MKETIMPEILLSISTTVFGTETAGKELPVFLDIIRQAGFTAIEISRKHLNIAARARQIADSGLKVWAVHGILEVGSISSYEAERRSAVDAEITRMEDTAMFTPCPYVMHYLDRYNDPEYGKNFRKSIEEIYIRSSQLGFDLTVETAPYKPQHNERYPDSREIAEFVRSFNAPDLNMTVDINHSNLKENLETVCENCRGLISNVHISDNHGKWEDHLPPGEGTIDLRKAFAALRANGYSGPCNLEFHLPEPPDATILRNIRITTGRVLA